LARAQVKAMLQTVGRSINFTDSFMGSRVALPGMAAYDSASRLNRREE
jgi:hypothetical protein